MTRRGKIITAVIVLLLLALAVLLWYLLTRRAPVAPVVNVATNVNAPRPALPVGGTPTSGGTVSAPVTQPVPEPVVDNGQAAVKRLAMSFAERFGSFSSEGDFENMTDLAPLMTPSVNAWVDGYVQTQRSAPRPVGYAGTTTRALNAKFDAFDDAGGTASVTVTTQRREASTGVTERVYYQDLALKFVKQGNSWLVDYVKWGNAPEVQ